MRAGEGVRDVCEAQQLVGEGEELGEEREKSVEGGGGEELELLEGEGKGGWPHDLHRRFVGVWVCCGCVRAGWWRQRRERRRERRGQGGRHGR